MKLRIMAFLLVGAVMSVLAGFGTYRYASALEAELASARQGLRVYGDTAMIPVPRGDFPRGTPLGARDFGQVAIPVSLLPVNVLTTLPIPPAGGRLVALRDMRQGAVMLKADLAAADGTTPIGALVSPDGSAIALRAVNLPDLLPMLQPGSAVDLVWTRPTGGGTSESRLIGTALRVLALPAAQSGADLGADLQDDAGPAILLEAPRAALLPLIQAEKAGTFHLLLSDGRRDMTAKVVVVGPGDLASLPLVLRESGAPSGGPTQAAAPYSRQNCQTAVIRGGARSVIEVPC